MQIPSPDKTRLPSSEPRANSTLLNINDNALSPNLPPLPPPVDMEFDESILSEVLTLYPRRCPESLSAEFSSEFQEEAVSKSRATPEWLEKLQSRFDEIIFSLIPTNEQVNERLIVFNYVRTIIHRSLGAHVYPMGSFTTRTFLPGGDVDISAFLTADQLDSWFVKVNEAMCLSSIGTENNSTGYSLPDGTFKRITIRNVSFINAWVKVVKGIVNNVEVDISANQIGALYAQALVDRLDEYVDKLHLFKRSILLIKAWCKYESAKHNSFEGGIFGAREGRLSTWSIVIMIIWIFNKFGREITHPFQVLVGFFCYFTEFDWTKYALTVQGPVSAEDLRPLPVDGIGEFYLLPLCGGYLPNDILDMYKDRFNYAKENSIARRREKYYNSINRSHSASAHDNDDNTSVHSEASRHSEEPESFRSGLSFDYEDDTGRNGGLISYSYYKRGLMNVMDPIQIKHNTTRAVDMNGYKAILESLYNGKKSVVKLCLEMKKYIIDPTSPGTLSFSPSRSSVSSSASSTLLNSPLFRDVPMIRKFMENTLNKLLEIKHSPTSTSMLNITNYHVLDSCPQQIEISLKYGELILASIVTPEALAKLIVSIIETKGPLPVGEIGKILQEMTGNESLSNVLRAQYRGLKKVVEGFHEVFQVGTEHPFNPLVHLHENYLKIRNEWWYDESKSAHLFVFSPDLSSTVGPVPRTRVRDYQGSELSSVSSDSNEKNDQFVALTKSRSFKEQSLYDRGDVKRSGSLSSAPIGIATGMLPNNNAMLASSPSGRNRNKNKNNANPLTSAANPPPRHSKQPQQQSTSNSNPQQQQYLQQQYYQQQYQQQIQYQTFLHQQQYYYTQQQMALLQQQANQNKEAGSSSTDGLETESIQSSSAVLEDSQGNSTNSPPAVPSSVPVNPYVMYSLPLHIPFSNQATSSNNELNGPTSPSHSSLSTSPTATGSFMQAPSGGVTLPMGFYPPLFNPMTQNQNSTPSSPISSQRSLSPTTSSAGPPTMPVIIPAMMKPPPYGLIYGSPPTNGLYGQYGMSPQSIGTFMVPSSLPQASSNSSKNGIDTPPTLPPRGHSS